MADEYYLEPIEEQMSGEYFLEEESSNAQGIQEKHGERRARRLPVSRLQGHPD